VHVDKNHLQKTVEVARTRLIGNARVTIWHGRPIEDHKKSSTGSDRQRFGNQFAQQEQHENMDALFR